MSDAPEDAPEQEAPSASPPAGSPNGPAEQPWPRFQWPRTWQTLHARSTRRALLLTALGGLLIAGVVVAVPVVDPGPGRLAGYLDNDPVPKTGGNGAGPFNRASSGDCLTWPDRTPEAATIVSCTDDHRFEVGESIDMRTFPGSEYGPNAAPPSAARIQQISQEQCAAAVHRYLGTKFDPNSKFSISMLWSGDRAWRDGGERRVLCGLQLPGANNQQIAFKGKVAEIDQSKVWPTGTCLGIDPTTNQPIDVPVDCAAPHAMEVTGTVNLAEKFPTALPAEPDQDGFIKDSCTRMTEAYLDPIKLRITTLTLIYSTLSLPSWSAGSREIACSIGATLGNGGWATLLNSAKGPLLINGQPPVPPPDIPEERLNQPPIPLQVPVQVPVQVPNNQPSVSAPITPPGNQHLPQQPGVTVPQSPPSHAPVSQAPAAQSPASQAPGAPPPPAIEGPLPPADGGGPPQDSPVEPAPAEPAPGG